MQAGRICTAMSMHQSFISLNSHW